MALKGGDLVICVGGGFFGAKAARMAREKGAKVVVIEKKAKCAARELCGEVIRIRAKNDASAIGADVETMIEAFSPSNTILLIGDGVEVLKSILKKKVPDWIVPAIPGHLIGKLTKSWLQCKGIEVKENSFLLDEVSKGISPGLILEKNKKEGVLIASFMPSGEICKMGCEQPMKCPVTGIEKSAKMYELLRFALSSSSIELSRILISKQIENRGVGAIKGEDVAEALKYFERHFFLKRKPALKEGNVNKGTDNFFAVGTSCSCHAILNFFRSTY